MRVAWSSVFAGSLSSLRVRLTIYSGGLAFILLLATWALIALGSRSYARSHSRTILETVGKELIEEMEPLQTAESDFPEMIEEINEAAFQTSHRLVILHLKGAEIVQRSHQEGPDWPLENDRDWMTIVLPYHGDSLVAALDFGKTQDQLDLQALAFAGVCLEVLLLIIVGSWILVGKVLAPMGQLSEQAQNAGMDLHTRLRPPSTDREITELVTTFNQLLDRLTESSALRSRFYAAASHELRTPLQALMGHLELALSKEREICDYKIALSEARGQTERLISLTQALLTLNRLEVDSLNQYQTVDLVDHCENEWLLLQPKAKAKQLKTFCHLPEQITLLTLPSYLTILLRNLLENAVKYSPPGGELRFSLEPGPRDAIASLILSNESETIQQDDMARLGEPFFRPDRSRQSSTGGNGLGLAICEAIAKNQRWDLEMTLADKTFQVKIIFCPGAGSKKLLG